MFLYPHSCSSHPYVFRIHTLVLPNTLHSFPPTSYPPFCPSSSRYPSLTAFPFPVFLTLYIHSHLHHIHPFVLLLHVTLRSLLSLSRIPNTLHSFPPTSYPPFCPSSSRYTSLTAFPFPAFLTLYIHSHLHRIHLLVLPRHVTLRSLLSPFPYS